MLIVLSLGSLRGVFARRFEDGARCGARGRGRTYPRTRGPRDPIGRYYGRSARNSLDWITGPMVLDGPRDELPMRRYVPQPRSNRTETRKRGPGDRNRRDGAPRGARILQKRMRQDGKTRCATRCSIPSLVRGGDKGKTAYPTPQRTRAMTHACLEFGCLTIGSETTRAFPRGSGRTVI